MRRPDGPRSTRMSQFRAERATGWASGKVILLGEHAVVHGSPAIAAGLEQGVEISLQPAREQARDVPTGADPRLAEAFRQAASLTGIPDSIGLSLSIRSELPEAVGFGSSAALAVGLVRACLAGQEEIWSNAEVAVAANSIEKIFHGRPSGIDATTAAMGGVLRFQIGPPLAYENVPLGAELVLLLVETGTRHTTSSTVGALGDRARAQPAIYQPVFDAITALVGEADQALRAGNLAFLGDAMTMNHGLLRALGVSTSELDDAVEVALEGGALGAKLTGAGGGGAILALCGENAAEIQQILQQAGYRTSLSRFAASPGA
ncbi:MAG TPA: mevalonate kinase [Deltaproteobacteria bacterium]|nr:mevalonate kinase [Deltaproteobacteria bacterium]